MIAAITTPITRYPARPPTASRITGAVAPASMIVNARIATRQVISRVRSSYDDVISAGIATYGTWKNAYADAAARKNTSTHAASSTRDPSSGAAKISANATASGSPARSSHGRRGPRGSEVRSLMRPAIGLRTTSQALGSSTMSPAASAAMPRLSVRYGSSIRPGTVPKAPVATEPEP